MKYFLIKRDDGGVSIMNIPPRKEDGSYPSQYDCIAKWADQSGIIEVVEIDRGDIPQDRTFRDAWGHDLSVDMPKARDIWRKKMRVVRKPKIEALDVEMMRAVGKRDNKAMDDVEKRKQALRDVTDYPAIEAAQTPEELKAVWPEVLK